VKSATGGGWYSCRNINFSALLIFGTTSPSDANERNECQSAAQRAKEANYGGIYKVGLHRLSTLLTAVSPDCAHLHLQAEGRGILEGGRDNSINRS
jgi:hypothetical protein